MRGWLAPLCLIGLVSPIMVLPTTGMAQKYPGTTVPTAPPPTSPPAAPPAYRPPPPVTRAPATQAPAAAAPQPGADAAAEALARRLPLPAATRDLTNQLPPDIPGVERRLGLRHPHGLARDMRGHVPTPQEIVNALAPSRPASPNSPARSAN